MKEDPKKPKATPAKKKSSTTNAENSVKNTAKASKLLQDTTPLMSADASFKHTVTASSRRNKSTVINRTDRYKNISYVSMGIQDAQTTTMLKIHGYGTWKNNAQINECTFTCTQTVTVGKIDIYGMK